MSHIKNRCGQGSGLQGKTRVGEGLRRRGALPAQIRKAPDVLVTSMGGHGAIGYGLMVMHPPCEEIRNLSKRERMPVVNGSGGLVRSRRGTIDKAVKGRNIGTITRAEYLRQTFRVMG